ncbi:MAG: HAD family hydrolase [Pseudomonadota bacterium]
MTSPVFFDFDGVIVDSVTVKTDAFVALYEDDGQEVMEAVRTYHLAHTGMSRYGKLRHFQRTLVGRADDDDTVEALAQQFGAIVKERVIASAEISGAEDTLRALVAAGIPAHVASATPQRELEEIIEARGLTPYFSGINGTPTSKREALETSTAKGAKPRLMVGDAMADFRAAHDAGVPFLGVVPNGHQSPFPEGTEAIADLKGLGERITRS